MTKNDFLQWKENTVTQEILETIRQTRTAYQESLVQLAAAGETVNSAKVAGHIESLDYLLNIEYEGEE